MQRNTVLSSSDVRDAVRRLAGEILAAHSGQRIALVGIHTRGVVLAHRLEKELAGKNIILDHGTLDISLYRDDLNNLAALPAIEGSEIPFEVEGSTILLCDDVLYTGRTIRAAMNVLLDYGRPRRIELAVLADRGHRELPIAATWTGVVIPTRRGDYLRVHFAETDGEDGIVHHTRESP
jgi:pyrimidine operon attenuation protein/uracil phosphoribosyltransferase